MSSSIARYLKDFGEVQPPAPTFGDMDGTSQFGDFTDPFADVLEADPAVDLEGEKQASFDQGHEAATQELATKFDAERAALKAEHAAEIEALRLQYTQELAGLVVTRLRDGTNALAQCLSEQAATLLAPVFSDELAEQAASGLANLVKTALTDAEAMKLVVKGPRELFDRLKMELDMDASQIVYSETDDIDLSVTIGESVFVTRMSAWASSLRKVMK